MKKVKLIKTLLIPTIGITTIGTIAAVSTSCSCSPVVIVTGVSLNKESLALEIGGYETLITTLHPEDATDKSVTWSSSDSGVATVDNNGNVTAVGEGQAIITVTTNDGVFTDTCQVTVRQEIIHVIGVWLNKESLALETGESDTLTATVHPENATDKSVTWSSSDSSVASVDNNGKVTAVKEGQATITVTTNDGGFTATCQVTVNQKIIHVTNVSLDKDSLTLINEGDSDTLIATLHPEDATDKSVTWSSSDSGVATVDNNGNVTAVGEGQATITVKTNDGGFTDTCQVTVRQEIIHVIGVLLNKELLTLGEGESETLTATVFPADATDKSVTWSSSDSSVATVDNNGKVTAVSKGQATIIVTTNDGGYEDYCDVAVLDTSNVIRVTANADSTLELRNEGGNNPNLQYSVDRRIWRNYSGVIRILTHTDLYLKGNNRNGWSQSEQTYSHFNITGNVSLYGNIMCLLDNGTRAISSTPNDYCFYGLFSNSPGITSVSENFLPATTLTKNCYDRMFIGCSSLTTAPNLPTTTLASNCYQGMFAHCTSLTTAPDLLATTLAQHCYEKMFSGCTSLTSAPKILPATNLADYCYYDMFKDCTSLTQVPTLPASKLAVYCYAYMFDGCLSLTTAPDLPATTLADSCYSYMFRGCTSLTTAPNLPATTLAQSCYGSMFEQCISLTTAPDLPATTLANSCYFYMFSQCTSLISAPALPVTTLADSCYDHMFCRCTSLITAPELPATTLASNCYQGMFSYCSSLTTAPAVLPATTLSVYCYCDMFDNCTSLKAAPELLATQLAECCYEYMFTDCTSLSLIKMAYTGNYIRNCFFGWVTGAAEVGVLYYNGSQTAQDFQLPSSWTKLPF